MKKKVKLKNRLDRICSIIPAPPERRVISEMQLNAFNYLGFEAYDEAVKNNVIINKIRHAEISPTYRCPEDCPGCPDRRSLHLNDPKEERIRDEDWFPIIDRLHDVGVQYFLLIGGTIDALPITRKLIEFILKHTLADVGWFTDGIMLLKNDGTVKPLLSKIIDAGLLDITTHVSLDYVVSPEGTASAGPILSSDLRWNASARVEEAETSRFYKSAFSMRLARYLIGIGVKRVVLNTCISAQNLKHVMDAYEFCKALDLYGLNIGSRTRVLWTCSPFVWRPHLARGDHQENYPSNTVLKTKHQEDLKFITHSILSDTLERMKNGQNRIAANSSGFLMSLPDFAISQDIAYTHPNCLSVTPNGTVWCDPMFANGDILKFLKNPYGYRDRDTVNNPFFHGGSESFPNLVQSTRGDGEEKG